MNKANELTQSTLKTMLRYNPTTGRFTWRAGRKPKAKPRSGAGCFSNLNGYRMLFVQLEDSLKGTYYEHRLAFLYMEGAFPPEEVEHLNRVKHDNRWDNLKKQSTHFMRTRRRGADKKLSKNNTSGFTGVFCVKRIASRVERWSVHYKGAYLGRFQSLEAAVSVRLAAEQADPLND